MTDAAGLAVVSSVLENPGGFYVNVHAGSQPGGLMRGQLRMLDVDRLAGDDYESPRERRRHSYTTNRQLDFSSEGRPSPRRRSPRRVSGKATLRRPGCAWQRV